MPVKEPVKSKYPPLTKEEKRKIIARHKDLVDKFNAILPEGQKVSYDKNLLKNSTILRWLLFIVSLTR